MYFFRQKILKLSQIIANGLCLQMALFWRPNSWQQTDSLTKNCFTDWMIWSQNVEILLTFVKVRFSTLMAFSCLFCLIVAYFRNKFWGSFKMLNVPPRWDYVLERSWLYSINVSMLFGLLVCLTPKQTPSNHQKLL